MTNRPTRSPVSTDTPTVDINRTSPRTPPTDNRPGEARRGCTETIQTTCPPTTPDRDPKAAGCGDTETGRNPGTCYEPVAPNLRGIERGRGNNRNSH